MKISDRLGGFRYTEIDREKVNFPLTWTKGPNYVYTYFFLKPGEHTVNEIQLGHTHLLHEPNKIDWFVYMLDGHAYCSNQRPPRAGENITRGTLIKGGRAVYFPVGYGGLTRTLEPIGARHWRSICFNEGLFWNTYEGSFSCRAGESFDFWDRVTLKQKKN